MSVLTFGRGLFIAGTLASVLVAGSLIARQNLETSSHASDSGKSRKSLRRKISSRISGAKRAISNRVSKLRSQKAKAQAHTAAASA